MVTDGRWGDGFRANEWRQGDDSREMASKFEKNRVNIFP